MTSLPQNTAPVCTAANLPLNQPLDVIRTTPNNTDDLELAVVVANLEVESYHEVPVTLP